MKKAGSSKSRSKTRPTSANTRAGSGRKKSAPATLAELPAEVPPLELSELAVGHSPNRGLQPQDEALFHAFQSNLLSLVSHELRTPLMGVLNGLTLLEDAIGQKDPPMPVSEIVPMLRRNAERLHQNLTSLLDLAAIESGTFHVRLREVDLERLVRARVEHHRFLVKDQGLRLEIEGGAAPTAPLLADPQKISRALDLCLSLMLPRARSEKGVLIRISTCGLELRFALKSELTAGFDSAWMQAKIGHQGGLASPTSAFAGVIQSEKEFLTRMEEGLGSELMLIHEIMRLHRGEFLREDGNAGEVTLTMRLPELSSEESLHAVLATRADPIAHELGSVALVLVRIPAGENAEAFRDRVRRCLYRTTDAVYVLREKERVALVFDDCAPTDVPKLVGRIEKSLRTQLVSGHACCPYESSDPAVLIQLAEGRLPK